MSKSRTGSRRFKTNLTPADKKYINKKIQSNFESKHINHNGTAVNISNAVLNTPLCSIIQGNDEDDRNGNVIFVTGFFGRYTFTYGDATNIIRVVLYIPKDKDDTLALIPHGIIDKNQFTVLEDRTIGVSSAGPGIKTITIKKKFNKGVKRGIKVEYDGTLGTDITSNSIKLAWVSDSAAAAHPQVTHYSTLYFKDA